MRAKRWFIAAALSLSVIHCAFSLDHDVLPDSKDRTPFFTNIAIDGSMDSSDIAMTKLALTEWDAALNGNLDLSYFVTEKPATNCVLMLENEGELPEEWKQRIEDGEIVLGYVKNSCVNLVKTSIEGLAWSNSVSYHRMLKTVVLHEFGHYIGMRHVSDSRSLMNRAYSASTPQCVTASDAIDACDAIGNPGGNCVATCGMFDVK